MLSRNDLRDDEKAKRYFQLQNRYLLFKKWLNTRTQSEETRSVRHIAGFWYVRMRSGSKGPMTGPRPFAYACAYVDPVLTSQSYDVSISRRRTNMSVFLLLMLMSPVFFSSCLRSITTVSRLIYIHLLYVSSVKFTQENSTTIYADTLRSIAQLCIN